MCSLANYNFVCKPRNDGYGGVGIYLKKHIRFRQINCDISLEVIGIRTINLRNNINIFSVYAAPSTDISSFQQGCDDLFTIAAQSSCLTVIGGDFNAKSSIWGNDTQDARGGILENSLLHSGFFCLNNGSPTYSHNPSYSSTLDLTFINSSNLGSNWSSINSKISNSNHFPILIEIDQISASTNIIKFNHKKIIKDFSKIQITTLDSISNSSQTIHSNNSIKINTNNRYVPKKYWDEVCEKLFRLRNACRQKYFKSKLQSDAIAYINSNKKLNSFFYKMRKENLNKLAEDISNPSSLKDMWNKIKNLKLYKDSEHRDFINQIATTNSLTYLFLLICFIDMPTQVSLRVNFLTS